MATIEERAEEYAWKVWSNPMFAQEWEDCKRDYIKGATEQKAIDEDAVHAIVEEQVLKAIEKQKAIDFAMFQSFLSERGLLFGKYTKANGDTGYKTLDDLWAYFNNKE